MGLERVRLGLLVVGTLLGCEAARVACLVLAFLVLLTAVWLVV